MHITCLLSRVGISSTFGSNTTQSTLRIESFFRNLLVGNFSGSCRLRSSRCSKSVMDKLTEQSTEVLDGFDCAGCLWTNIVHFAPTKLSLGNGCIDITSVVEFLATDIARSTMRHQTRQYSLNIKYSFSTQKMCSKLQRFILNSKHLFGRWIFLLLTSKKRSQLQNIVSYSNITILNYNFVLN